MPPPPRKKNRKIEPENNKAERDPDFAIRYEIDSISIEDGGRMFTETRRYKELSWKMNLTAFGSGNDRRFYVGLFCSGNQSPIWRAEVKHKVILVNRDSSKNINSNMMSSIFSNDNDGSDICKERFANYKDFMNEEQGFINDDCITIEHHIWITSSVGIRSDPVYDFAQSTESHQSLTLVFDGDRVHVSRELLAIHSPVFNAMFYGSFDERGKNEIALEDVNAKEFAEMLRLLYPTSHTITDDNVCSIVALADRFQIQVVLDMAENFLLSSETDRCKNLWLADSYRMVQLKEKCMEQLNTQKDVKDLKKSPYFDKLSGEMKSELLEIMFKFVNDSDDES